MATLEIPAVVSGIGVFTTLIGGTSCISTNDGGATYMQEHVALGSGVFSGFNDTVAFPATTIPGTINSVSLVTVTKGTDPRSFGRPGNAVAFMLDDSGHTYSWQTVFADGATDWTELVTPLTDGTGAEVVTKSMIEGGTVDYNPGGALLNCGAPGPIDFTCQWTYIALRVDYSPLNPAPLRLYPGASTSNRLYPRSLTRRPGWI